MPTPVLMCFQLPPPPPLTTPHPSPQDIGEERDVDVNIDMVLLCSTLKAKRYHHVCQEKMRNCQEVSPAAVPLMKPDTRAVCGCMKILCTQCLKKE